MLIKVRQLCLFSLGNDWALVLLNGEEFTELLRAEADIPQCQESSWCPQTTTSHETTFCCLLEGLLQDKLITRVDGRVEGAADGLPLCFPTFVNQQLKGWRNKVGVLQDVLA